MYMQLFEEIRVPALFCRLLAVGIHDDVIKWKHFPRYWPFVSLICACLNGWVNIREAGDLRRHRTNYGGIVMRSLSETIVSLIPTYENKS